MSQTTATPTPLVERSDVPRPYILPAGVGLTSFASLLLELGLTRLFSVVLFYHYAFLAISVALLGLGAGGVFAHLRRDWLSRWDTRRLAAEISLTCSLVVVLVLEVILHTPVGLHVALSNFVGLSVIYFASAGPFFLVGLLFSVIFARHSESISRLYGADLTGGALACLTTVPLLNWIGGPNLILLAAAALSLAGILWTNDARWRLRAT